jgi:hypothetical protein
MKWLVRLEYAVIFFLSIPLSMALPFAWWWYPLLFLVPDIGMLGYLKGPKLGAFTYNITHWLPIAVVTYVAAALLGYQFIAMLGAIMIGHIGLDRALGFGLKYDDSFKHTHLDHI